MFWIASQIVFHLIHYDFIKIPYYEVRDFNYHPLMHLNQFLIGNLAGLYFLSNSKSQPKNNFIIIVFLLFLLLILLRYPIGLIFHNGLLALVFVPLILFISSSTDFFTKLFSKKGFVFLGEISFSIYILQVPVWNIFTNYRMEKYFGFDQASDFTLSFLVRLLILIIFSVFSYLIIEKPLRVLIKKSI